MAQSSVSKTLRIAGMTCANCEARIEKKLKNTNGIKQAKISYASGMAHIVFNPGVISLAEIEKRIEVLGYRVTADEKAGQLHRAAKALGAVIILLALYMPLNRFGLLNIFNAFPLAREGMGYGMLLVIGLLTSVHCVSMCGGINLSQCMGHGMRPSLLYNLGRVASYTMIGGIVGAIGSAISFSGVMQAAVQLAAGLFMVVMGLNMLDIFPWLRRLAPRIPKLFTRGINDDDVQKNGPLFVGLLNGLMPCGPLQAMQLYALSTGDPIKGALSMLLFGLGTAPLMFGLGAAGSLLSRKYTNRIMTVGAALVVMMGVSMFQSGAMLSGLLGPIPAAVAQNTVEAEAAGDIQHVTSRLSPRGYEPITVKAGVPVRWTIRAESGAINGCNNAIIIPEYGIAKQLAVGENIIEFTPENSGTFPYSCWMGMIWSSITVE